MGLTLSRRVVAALLAGIVVRVALVVAVVPVVQVDWFEPFLRNAFANPSLDPWQSWLDTGGASDAFPYGPVMLVFFGLFGLLTSWLPIDHAFQLGIALGILVVELACWWGVWRTAGRHSTRGLVAFAAAPIVLYAAYVHGQLDLLPAALMFAAAIFMRRDRWRLAGLLLGLAVAAKFSSLLLVPLLVVFFLRNTRFRSAAKPLVIALLPGLVLSALPILLPGYRTMVLATPQVESLVAFGLTIGPQFTLLIAPIVLAALVVLFWRYRRGNSDVLFLFFGLLLAIIPLAAPASPGWYLWSVPFLAVIASEARLRHVYLVWGLWAALAAATSATHSWGWIRGALPADLSEASFVRDGYARFLPSWGGPLLDSAMVAVGVVVLWVVVRAAIARFDRYKLSRAPLSVAVAGDSGTGKDTLCRSLADVFEGSESAFLLGDDYHNYERSSPVWKVKTHLDPSANNLSRLMSDTMQLLQGEPVWSRHYDHDRGRFTQLRKVREGDLVVVSGLHVLTSIYVRSHVDLTVFLDMDEDLRTLFKVERDMRERGHDPANTLKSIARRAGDRERFIQPQLELADLVLRLEASVPVETDFSTIPAIPPLDVVATLKDVMFGEDFVRAMTSIAGAEASVEYLETPGAAKVRVSGTDWLTPRDIGDVAAHLIERPRELFLREPRWLGGSRGVSQLILVLALLDRRKIALELNR
jgi:uridine kinase